MLKLQTLQSFRERYGLSYADISSATKLKIEWLQEFELGKKEPWPEAIRRISAFFGVQSGNIFPELFQVPPMVRPCSELKQMRQSKNMSQVQLGFKARLNSTYISRFEHGAVKPWPAAIERLSAALQEPKDKLFPHLCNENGKEAR